MGISTTPTDDASRQRARKEIRRILMCLRLELPKSVADDVSCRILEQFDVAFADAEARREKHRCLTRVQADKIETELRRLESDADVTKTELRLFLQHPMPCGHAAGNLLICPDPPYRCVICGEPAGEVTP